MAETRLEFVIIIPGGKKYVLRDDGYRVYAQTEGEPEDCVFEYKHSDVTDAGAIVKELLVRASVARNAVNATQGYEPDQTPMSVSPDWKSDGTGFRA